MQPHPVDRLSWLWLAIGAILLPFTAWQTVIPLAGWFAPLLLLRFSRTQPARAGLPVLLLVSCVVGHARLRGRSAACAASRVHRGPARRVVLARTRQAGQAGARIVGWWPFTENRALYGRLASIICVDADFPSTARLVGAANADILVLPVDDWQQITPYHTDLLTLRAIESGAAVLRPAVQGLARAIDAQGRVLAQADYFANDTYLLLTDLPTRGARTPYARIGDSLAYLCLAGFGLRMATALAGRRFASHTQVPVPQST